MQENHSFCQNCQNTTDNKTLETALQELGHPLCRSCQANLKMKLENSVWEAINLCLSLKKRGVPAELEKYDASAVPERAIPETRITIDADATEQEDEQQGAAGQQHYQTFRNGFLTLRIPSALADAKPEETANYIAEFLAIDQSGKSLRNF